MVQLAMPHAIEVLCASMGKQILTPGVVVGNDLAFWATVLRFAGTLTAQHQFLPGLVLGASGVSRVAGSRSLLEP